MSIQDGILAIHDELPAYLPLREVVYQTLKKAILNGDLRPGQLLSENQIASQLSVSRTPVREAIRSLENENLLTVLSGRKVVVSIPSIEEIEEIYDIRLIIEKEAIRRIKPDDTEIIERLEDCLELADRHLKNEDLKELHKTNAEFHLTIISALQNNKLKKFLDSLQDTISLYRLYSLTDGEWASNSEEEHTQIINFLKQGNTEGAIAVLHEHLSNAKEIVKVMFQNSENNP